MSFYMHVFLFSASEPNLKVRSALKQKVMERRITQSPILRRREYGRDKGFLLKRKAPLSSMYDSFVINCWNFSCDSFSDKIDNNSMQIHVEVENKKVGTP